jgi:hypothetical protein
MVGTAVELEGVVVTALGIKEKIFRLCYSRIKSEELKSELPETS